MTMQIEQDGEITLVTLDRPDVRNAVDRAHALYDAYFGVYCRRFGLPLIDGGTPGFKD